MSSDSKQAPSQGNNQYQYYGLATPNGQKVSIALEELGVPYDTHVVKLNGMQFEDWFKAINPNSKIPALVDKQGPDGKPITIFESGAILLYLAERTGKLLPKDPAKKWEAIEWVFWQMSGLGPMFGQVGHFYRFAKEDVPYAKERYLTEAKRLLKVLETKLGQTEYVAGNEYTIADIACWPWVKAFFDGNNDKIDLSELPNTQRWVKKVGDRPAVQKGSIVAKM